jgi:hypothetical protein
MIIIAILLMMMNIVCGHALYTATAGPKNERLTLGIIYIVINGIIIISAFFLK